MQRSNSDLRNIIEFSGLIYTDWSEHIWTTCVHVIFLLYNAYVPHLFLYNMSGQ